MPARSEIYVFPRATSLTTLVCLDHQAYGSYPQRSEALWRGRSPARQNIENRSVGSLPVPCGLQLEEFGIAPRLRDKFFMRPSRFHFAVGKHEDAMAPHVLA